MKTHIASVLLFWLFATAVNAQPAAKQYGEVVFNYPALGRYPKTIYDFIPQMPRHDSISCKIVIAALGSDAILPVTHDRIGQDTTLINVHWENKTVIFVDDIVYYVNGEKYLYHLQAFVIDEQLRLRKYIQ